jgi:hypothetical protein
LLWHSSSGSPSAGKPQDAEWLKQLGSVTSSDTLDGTLAQPDGVALAASKVVALTEQDVVDMNRRLGGDVSLNAPIRHEGDSSEWQNWLVDEICDQGTRLAESEESDHRRKALGEALSVLNNRERVSSRRAAWRMIRSRLGTWPPSFGVSRERVRQIEGARLREGAAGSEKPGHRNLDAPDGLLVSSPRTWSLQPLDREV